VGDGGYDDGYAACPCFWGREPGSLVARFLARVPDVAGWDVLDAGCGEGKNAHALMMRGARVTAVDTSALALHNAREAWPSSTVAWVHADVRRLTLPPASFDLVVAYGLLHCLACRGEVEALVARFQAVTRAGGRHVICAFNERRQELMAHPGFEPCLIPHSAYLDLYRDWDIEEASDEDLHETHPHNRIAHVHSLTRLTARRPA